MQPVLGLVPDGGPRAVENVGCDLLTGVRRQAVQDDRIVGGRAEQVGVDPERRQVGAAAFGLLLVAHTDPDVGVDRIGPGGGEARVVGQSDAVPLLELVAVRRGDGQLDAGELTGNRQRAGDGNNVARSLAIACELVDVELTVAAPDGYQLEEGHGVKLTEDPRLAVSGADAIYTDVWVSMGDEEEAERRRSDLTPFRVDADLLAAAKDSAVVLHCLPAHPGEEITADVLYGPRSAVWDQAENRLHTQKALLSTLLGE